jgi:hypothetical protein
MKWQSERSEAIGRGQTAWCVVMDAHQAQAQPEGTALALTRGAAHAESPHGADNASMHPRPLACSRNLAINLATDGHRRHAHVRSLAGSEAARPRHAPLPPQRPPPRPPLQRGAAPRPRFARQLARIKRRRLLAS